MTRQHLGLRQHQVDHPSDNGETATLVFATPFSDWKSLFGPIMPDYVAKANGGDGTKAELSAATTYFSKTVPTWSGGPYLITKFQKATAVTEVPNPKWPAPASRLRHPGLPDHHRRYD